MEKTENNVSMRIRIGECELEVSGPKSFVEAKIKEFIANQKEYVPTQKKKSTTSDTTGSQTHSETPKKNLSVAQFFKQASPKSDVDRALLAGYFLEKYKNEESFTSVEVKDVIRSAKISPPKNPSDTIAKNIKKGYMMSAGDKDGKLAFVLTSDGEEAVEESIK